MKYGTWLCFALQIPLLTALAACDRSATESPPLAELQEPLLERFDAEVQRQLSEAYTEARRLMGPPLVSRQKAAAACGQLGRLYLVYELTDAAAASFQNACLLDPDSVPWNYYLGVLLEGQGNFEEAALRFRQVTEAQPNGLAAWVRLGDVEFGLGDYKRAEAAYRQALKLAPGSAAAHFGLGRLAAQRSDHGRAVRHFQEALRLQPAASQIHYALAQSYRHLGNLESARDQLAQRGESPVSFADPRMAELATLTVGAPGHAHRADQAVLEGRFRDALPEYRKAVSLAPRNYDYRKSLALTQYQIGESDAAIQSMRGAISLLAGTTSQETRSPRAKELSLAHYTLGGMLANQGDANEAREEFQQAVALDPANLGARLQIGRLEGQVGNLEEALVHFKAVLGLNPAHPEANRLAATTCMDLGRFREALPYLRVLTKLEPDNQRDLWLLKVATERAGKR